jgi:hypothetical protein
MQAELQSLQEYGAWSIVEKPENAKVISFKGVLNSKRELMVFQIGTRLD